MKMMGRGWIRPIPVAQIDLRLQPGQTQ
jgi:hypothetical protein